MHVREASIPICRLHLRAAPAWLPSNELRSLLACGQVLSITWTSNPLLPHHFLSELPTSRNSSREGGRLPDLSELIGRLHTQLGTCPCFKSPANGPSQRIRIAKAHVLERESVDICSAFARPMLKIHSQCSDARQRNRKAPPKAALASVLAA